MTKFQAATRAGLAILLLGVLLQAGLQAQQAPVDVSGSYTGRLDGTGVCTNLADGNQTTETLSADLTFTLTASNGTFTGQGTFVDTTGENDTGSFEMQGVVDAVGNFTGDLHIVPDDGDESVGFLEGSLNGDTLTLAVDVTSVQTPASFDVCIDHGSGTFTRASTDDPNVFDPEETPGSVVTAPVILKTQVQAITTGLNARINDIVRGVGGGPRGGQRVTANGVYEGVSGLSAGEGGPSYGVWASYSYSDFENDFSATLLDGHRHNVLFGADMTPRDNMVLGLAGGYEFASIDTDFNSGDQDTDGFTIAPYFGLVLSDNWNVSASVGYSSLDTDQFRTDALGARITSNPDSDRWFGTLNLNGYTTWNDWLFSGRIGMLQARNIQESFDESDGTEVGKFTTELGQWNVGGEAAYGWGDFEPYLRATYERDFSQTRLTLAGTGPQPSKDDDNFLFGLGLRYFSSDNGLSGNIEWYKRLGREDYDEDTFSATVRWDF